MKLAEALDGNPKTYVADSANVARAPKAFDGTVYRANQYMLIAYHPIINVEQFGRRPVHLGLTGRAGGRLAIK